MKIVIIGNGIAGITAARWLRKLSDTVEITVISDETDYFFSRPALMYIYMGHMRFKDTKPYEDWFWDKNRIKLLRGRVDAIDFKTKVLSILNLQSSTLNYDKLIIATGSKPNKFGWKGQDLEGVQGLYHIQDVEAMVRHTNAGIKRAIIVGGGLIGIEMAEMFHSQHIPVSFLVRENSFWNGVLPAEESAMINRHIEEHHIELRLSSELDSILDENNDGKVDAIILKNGEKIPCDFVGLTVGVSPNVNFLKETDLKISRGVLVNSYLETNIQDVYAIGDCAEIETPQYGRRSIEAIWYTGKMMGETVAHTILGKKIAYNPGLWFNSAKFLDIEYQVYGTIQPQLPDNIATLYWEYPDGKKSIRINFDKYTEGVVGFNLMGIRYRHEVCEKWIQTQTPIENVLQNLGIANFDPEFFTEYEGEIIDVYNKKFGKKLQLKTKRGLNAALKFLKQLTL